jgi:hypothetical protein
MGRACSTYKGKKINYGVLLGCPVEKRPLGRQSHTWEDNIKTDLRKIK